ncbi:unnamed protein product [Adineta steineri]|uniref:Kazal-like domain-containing protein n=1 Tax=Adineta steineri TaxID=433720 RepID=A0A819P230_9BILA|nr:unnamed protein product [Adineta steineri]
MCSTILTYSILLSQFILIIQAGNCFYNRAIDVCYGVSELDTPEEQCTGSYYSDEALQVLDGHAYAENCRDVNVLPKRCDADCGLGQECQYINGEEMCVCSEESCTSSTKTNQQSLCASNNMTFQSKCLMEAWKCSNHQSALYVKYEGECQKDCRNVKCGHGKICLLVKNTGEPMCYPKAHCKPGLNPEPVCGTNGVSYPSICAMRLSRDQRGYTPEVAHKGSCENQCRPGLCQSYELCVYSKHLRPVCIRCQYPPRFFTHSGECSMNVSVCGNNGMLYKNYCSLLLDQCHKKESINIIDYGQCPTMKSKQIRTNKSNYLNQLTNYKMN